MRFIFFLFKDGTCGQGVTLSGQPSVAPMGHNVVVSKLTLKMPIRIEHRHAKFRNSVFALGYFRPGVDDQPGERRHVVISNRSPNLLY